MKLRLFFISKFTVQRLKRNPMHSPKKNHPKVKTKLHPRNKNRERYNFRQLIACCPELETFVKRNKYDDESIDFANPKAVKTLNKALLTSNYQLAYWDIPANYLCPPIPGRADYIHYMADLLAQNNSGKIPTGPAITCLDIGTGANCIYPIIGAMEYDWSFIGSDIDSIALESAQNIVAKNPQLKGKVEFRLQHNSKDIFNGIIQQNEQFDLTVCNPPFHASLAEAQAGTRRKIRNLNSSKPAEVKLNFGGQNNELWCEGGEEAFLKNMILQSKQLADSCFWFSSLISKQDKLESVYRTLKQVEVADVKTIPMGQGNKISRIVAWTFLSPEKQTQWKSSRWSSI